MIKELSKIPSGLKGWIKYEKFCIKALNFLFVPPFRRVHYQARNNDGYERRDAILPNNSVQGFWFDIKNEFRSKNIVCEFKNIAKSHTKESLNQLRIYLSKPTIGKFGLLFVRENNDDKNLRRSQRDAYEQNGILILIITDAFLERLLIAKAYFDTCDDIIANEKVRFEINY